MRQTIYAQPTDREIALATKRTERKLGKEFRKIQPKLRMIAKANDVVNAVRSDFASAVRVRKAKERQLVPPVTTPVRFCGKIPPTKLKAPKLKETSSSIEVNVFLSKFAPSTKPDGIPKKFGVTAESTDGSIATATLQLSQLAGAAELQSIAHIELGEPLKAPDPIISTASQRRPALSLRNVPGRDSGGRDVLIGIIDVGGFDFSHEDFLDTNGKTRWLRIWDQGGGLRPAPHDLGFDYGSEITKTDMDTALAGASAAGAPAWALEPQSQMSVGSHGTHVASIAAGNHGICRNAYLAGVLIDLPDNVAFDRRKSFYDSTRVAHAIDYLVSLADKIRLERGLDALPVSINISLGTNGGAHDASNGVSRWIDSCLTIPGRNVCVAAGNAGQEKSEAPGDLGFLTGRIHTSGRIEARGLTTDIEWLVIGNGIADVSENELELWYSASDRFAVSVTPPGMDTLGPVQPREYIQNEKLSDGSFVSIYNELYHPSNGENYIGIYLSPFLKENPVVGVRPGTWKIRLHGVEVRDGRYHGWIERDDPRPLGIIGTQEYWNFPSLFSQRSNVDNSSVSSLACGERVVSVANLHQAEEKINISSSQGPTRDGRPKPDVAAPGTDIVAANGFAGEGDGAWVAMTGTSMASPYVAGVVGLMLEVAPRLTAAQIRGVVQRTSQPLPGRNYEWADDSGYGIIDAKACVAEARNLSRRVKLNP